MEQLALDLGGQLTRSRSPRFRQERQLYRGSGDVAGGFRHSRNRWRQVYSQLPLATCSNSPGCIPAVAFATDAVEENGFRLCRRGRALDPLPLLNKRPQSSISVPGQHEASVGGVDSLADGI